MSSSVALSGSSASASSAPVPASLRSTIALVDGLLKVPPEVRVEIYRYLLPNRQMIDMTIGHKKRGIIPGHFKHFNNVMQDCKLLFVRSQLCQEALYFMWAQNYFYSKIVDSLSNIPVLIGETAAASIRYFNLTMSFQLKVNYLGAWISTLGFLVKELPGLDRLVLRADFPYGQPPFRETDGDGRYGQERRALLTMGAYLTLRHPKLRFLVWPADSGPTNEPNQWRVNAHVVLYSEEEKPNPLDSAMVFGNFGDESKKLAHDMILNSTAIRRTLWSALDSIPPATFALNAAAVTSEIPETNRNFDRVHKYSYLPASKRRELGDRDPTVNNSTLIRRAEGATRQQEQVQLAAEANARASFQGRRGCGAGGFGQGRSAGGFGGQDHGAGGFGRFRGRGSNAGGMGSLTNGMGQMDVNGRGRGGYRGGRRRGAGQGIPAGNWRGN